MKLRMILVIFILTATLIMSQNIWSEDLRTTPERFISSTATATLQIFDKQFLVESSPTGNSIPGLGKGTPTIVILPRLEPITSQNQSFNTSTHPK